MLRGVLETPNPPKSHPDAAELPVNAMMDNLQLLKISAEEYFSFFRLVVLGAEMGKRSTFAFRIGRVRSDMIGYVSGGSGAAILDQE